MSCTLSVWVATVALTWPVRGLGFGLIIYSCGLWLRQSKRSTSRELLVRLLRQLLRTWISAELFFMAYYLLSKRWVQARATVPPLQGDRVKLLKKCLRSIEMIHEGRRLETAAEKDALSFFPSVVNESRVGCSIEALLRKWSSEPSIRDPQEELRALKRRFVSGWFLGSDPEDVWWGNYEGSLAWAFFDSDVESLCPKQLRTLKKLVEEVQDWTELSIKGDTNPNVRAVKLSHDHVPTKYRPLVFYTMCAAASDVVNYILLCRLGFAYHRTGSLRYWRYPGTSSETPIVFCHGIGIGIVPYIGFIRGLVNLFSEREIFLIEVRSIMIRPQSMKVPSSAEMVLCIQEMLSSWGPEGIPRAAHFIAHSFGTIVAAWMIMKSKELVAAATLLAPCPFLLMSNDLCVNFLYHKPTTFREVMFDYYVSREASLAYYFRRNFVWHRNNLWVEELKKVPCLVILFAKDEIVPSYSVRYYLTAAKNEFPEMPLEVLWYPKSTHAGMLHNRNEQTKILNEIVRMGF